MGRYRKVVRVSAACLLVGAAATSMQHPAGWKRWTTSSFLDWVDGTTADGGANTYVAADGSVRLINLWDLNNDGAVDLVFASTHEHNEKTDLFLYWGGHGYSTERRSQLPTDGAKAVATADLNGDGYPELIVVNNFNGTRTDLNSYIYWGSAQGYSAVRRTELPTQGGVAVAVADLNGDGSPDLVFANSGLTYHVSVDAFRKSFIYWGAHGKYSPERRSELPTVNCRDVKIADLNGDGQLDIVFANEGNNDSEAGAMIYWGSAGGDYSPQRSTRLPGERSSSVAVADLNGDGHPDLVLANAFRLKGRELGMYNMLETEALNSFVYWGSAQGFSAERRTELPTVGAQHAAVADLNGDGRPDIVFSNRGGGASYIYWNIAGGFRPNQRTALPTHSAAQCAIADLNGDGLPDLAFANFSDGITHNTMSCIYWNSPRGFSIANRTEVATRGATGVVAADFNGDGEKDLAFANNMDGIDGGLLDSWIYYGNQKGEFTPARRAAIPTHGPNAYAAADLNRDGLVDLVIPSRNTVVFWGAKTGYSAAKQSVISGRSAFSARVADFNRDGYLDVATSEWTPGSDEVGLYWGGPSGFSAENRFVFRLPGVRLNTVADLNRDGWPDLIFSTTNNRVVIFWNGPNGFDNTRKTELPASISVSVEVADLNADGYLDIIVSNLWEENPPPGKPRSFGGSAEAGTLIYWGGPEGYSVSRRQLLPTVGNEDAAVADLNGDGRLDLVLSSYHAGDTRAHPSYIYWNGPNGFEEKNVTMLPTNSASGVLIADFNRDGYKDILFACHSKDGNHRNDSFLYWGGADGFSVNRRSLIPARGPHFMTGVDIGNIYDRCDRYDYISRPFDGGNGARFEKIEWSAEAPFRTRVEFQVRHAETRQTLESAPWHGPQGPKSYYLQPGPLATVSGQWIQFKASLVSPDLANTPVLRSVSIAYR